MKRYSKELRDAPSIPFKGLTVDDPKDGGFTKAVNVDFVNGEANRRNPHLIIDTTGQEIIASKGFKSIYE